MTRSGSFALLVLFLLSSCNSLHDKTLLHGEWSVHSWVIKSRGKSITNQMDFTFSADDSYTVDYGSLKESGTYYIAGEYLHTKANGEPEISVMITKLVADTLIFDMNRAGSLEEVVLVKR